MGRHSHAWRPRQTGGTVPKTEPTEAEIEKALREADGVCKAAAEQLACTPETVRRQIRRSTRLQQALAEIAADNLDIAETELLAGIRQGKLGAIIYYLRTKGRAEGAGGRVVPMAKDGLAGEAFDLSRLSDEELRLLDELLTAAATRAEGSDKPASAPRGQSRARRKNPR